MNLFRRKAVQGVNNLRSAIHMSRASEDLDSLPDRFATVIDRFEALDIDPNFRADIFHVLNGACDVALSMVDKTFPVEQANNAISKQLAILSRTILYLQSRPASSGFSILLPERGQLVGHYSTREEAEEQLKRYQSLGISRDCQVVPTKVLSLHAVQPVPLPVQPPVFHEVELPNPNEIIPPDSLPPGYQDDTSLNLTPEHDLRIPPTPGVAPGELGSPRELLSRLDALDSAASNLPRDHKP